MKAALYLRVSTEEQNLDNQRAQLETYAKQRGFEIVQVYQESESAWRAGHQMELAKLLSGAHRYQFQVVLCWALDRLSRGGSLAILKLIDRLGQYGVKVISFQESWTEAPGELAEVLYAIAGWVARMESQRLSERTRAGLARARQEGRGKRGPDSRERKRRWYRKPREVRL